MPCNYLIKTSGFIFIGSVVLHIMGSSSVLANKESTVLDELQHSINTSTALQILEGRDLSRFYAIVTGANSGIGFETARALSLSGAHVVLACRNVSKANEAKRKILAENPSAKLEFMQIDLKSFASVRQFAENYKRKNWPLHMLILNAGVLQPYFLTEDGLESTFQVNYLAQFYLTQLLKDVIMTSQIPRIIHVASGCHGFIEHLDPDTLTIDSFSLPQCEYDFLHAHYMSKLCNVLFSKQIHELWSGDGVTSLSLHPGSYIATNIFDNWEAGKQAMRIHQKSPNSISKEQAAATVVHCAATPGLEQFSGQYFEDFCVVESSPLSNDLRLAGALWDISIQTLKLKGFM